jgi:hypothetical protein
MWISRRLHWVSETVEPFTRILEMTVPWKSPPLEGAVIFYGVTSNTVPHPFTQSKTLPKLVVP